MGQSSSLPTQQPEESGHSTTGEVADRSPTKGIDTPVLDTARLHRAVRNGHLKRVEELLEKPGVDVSAAVSAVNESGDTCLHVAAKIGDAEITALLLHHGAETDRMGSRSRTPLHLACIYGNVEAVDVLLTAGADANVVLMDANGYQHVRLPARVPGHFACVRMCLPLPSFLVFFLPFSSLGTVHGNLSCFLPTACVACSPDSGPSVLLQGWATWTS